MKLQRHKALTIAGQTLRALCRYPDRIAFAWDGGALRYDATVELIGRLQAVLLQEGARRGGRVAILSNNGAESWCAAVAAQGLGLSVTWLHPRGSSDDQLFQVENSEATLLLVDAATHAAHGGELCAGVAPQVRVFSLGPSDFAPDLLARANAAGSATPVDVASPDDIALIHYTGGTTGRGKGVVRSNQAAVAFGSVSILSGLEIPATPRYLALTPNSHAGGTLLLPAWQRGGTIHLANRFDPSLVLRTIAQERINCTFIVPTMLYALLDEPNLDGTDLSSLESVCYGAAPTMAARLLEALERVGPVFMQGYGQTECWPISVLGRQDHDPAQPDLLTSCGAPVPNCDVRLLGPDGNDVGLDQPGELCARTPAAMDGYWKLPDLTAETLADGWVHTGDIARMDERGYLYIIDRKKDLIISGGFNIYPREVENALASHEAVGVCAVVGVPDAHWGEAVIAAVVPRPGCSVEPASLIDHVKAAKGSLYAPKRIEILPDLPTTALGKMDKIALRKQLSR